MRSKEELHAQIRAYEDEALVQVGWDEWSDLDIDERIKEDVRKDLEEAERQLRVQVVLSAQGRGRLRRFLLMKWLYDQAEPA